MHHMRPAIASFELQPKTMLPFRGCSEENGLHFCTTYDRSNAIGSTRVVHLVLPAEVCQLSTILLYLVPGACKEPM